MSVPCRFLVGSFALSLCRFFVGSLSVLGWLCETLFWRGSSPCVFFFRGGGVGEFPCPPRKESTKLAKDRRPCYSGLFLHPTVLSNLLRFGVTRVANQVGQRDRGELLHKGDGGSEVLHGIGQRMLSSSFWGHKEDEQP